MAGNAHDLDLFRFVTLRPPQLLDANQLKAGLTVLPPRPVDGAKPVKLAAAKAAKSSKSKPSSSATLTAPTSVAEAEKILARSTARTMPSTLGTPIRDFSAFLSNRDDRPTPAAVHKWIEDTTGKTVDQLTASSAFISDWERVGSNFLALLLAPHAAKLTPGETLDQRVALLLRWLRCFGLLDLMAKAPTTVDTPDEIELTLLVGILLLPVSFPRRDTNLVRPPAIADLQVVRLDAAEYELGDIAHIENVMIGERRARVHKRLDESEVTSTSESDSFQEQTQDLQTTKRSELQTETQRQLSEAVKIDASLAVSASYGPTVSIKANAGFAYETSRQESTRAAATFSNELVQRSTERVSQRIRETRTARALSRIEERNVHAFDNRGKDEPVVGVYRWVNKRQKAWLDTYGRRLMLEYLVPEPAALLRWSMSGNRSSRVAAVPAPPKFENNLGKPLTPDDITNLNWTSLAGKFGAAGVKPPPAPAVLVGTSLSADPPTGNPGQRQSYAANKEIQIPAGYEAQEWSLIFLSRPVKDPPLDGSHPEYNFRLDVAVGNTRVSNTDPTFKSWQVFTNFSAPFPTGTLPLAIGISDIFGYSATFEVKCLRIGDEAKRWQVETFDLLRQGHEQQQQDYESRIADLGQAAWGSNPLINRQTERRELKRSVLEMMMGSEFDKPPLDQDANRDVGPDKRPALDLATIRKEAATIEFLEQAFEWSEMGYAFYSYFWSDKEKWKADSLLVDEADPQFASFLASGAARVVVPVRPGFEGAVSLYQATGLVWSGAEPPTPADSTFVSIARENMEALGLRDAPQTSVALDDVVVPTDLVFLQDGHDAIPT